MDLSYYTGTGDKEAPLKHLVLFHLVAKSLSDKYLFRSGDEDGVDSAFREGAESQGEIYLPWTEYNDSPSRFSIDKIRPELVEKAKDICRHQDVTPWFDDMDSQSGLQLFHLCKVFEVLGIDLSTPSKFLIIYTPNGETKKDDCSQNTTPITTAIKVAQLHGVPTFNSQNPKHFDRLVEFANKKGSFYKDARSLMWEWMKNPCRGIPEFNENDAKQVMEELVVYKPKQPYIG